MAGIIPPRAGDGATEEGADEDVEDGLEELGEHQCPDEGTSFPHRTGAPQSWLMARGSWLMARGRAVRGRQSDGIETLRWSTPTCVSTLHQQQKQQQGLDPVPGDQVTRGWWQQSAAEN